MLLACLVFSTQPTAHAKVKTEMLVSTNWLAEHLKDPDLVVLCVAGAPEFYSNGHIPGSRLVRLQEIAITRDGIPNELPPASELKQIFQAVGVTNRSRIVLYGERSGMFAARGYFTLDYLGAGGRAALLDGGLEKWRAENRELSTRIPQVKTTALTVRLNPAVLTRTSDVQNVVSHQSYARLIDARPADEYLGTKLSEDVSSAGHIPGAAGVYWMKFLESAANPVLRPESELRQMFEAAGAPSGVRVVTYCRTGMQAAFDYFVAKYLGYNAQLYDASFYEWSRKDLPVEPQVKR